jgi:hypothetical protein
MLINEMIQFNDKNTIQIFIGDYDIMGSQNYKGLWLKKYSEIKEEMKKKNEYPLYVNLNE